jgi:hypothetical protein
MVLLHQFAIEIATETCLQAPKTTLFRKSFSGVRKAMKKPLSIVKTKVEKNIRGDKRLEAMSGLEVVTEQRE